MFKDFKPFIINTGLVTVASVALGLVSSKVSSLVITKIPHPAARLVALFVVGGATLLVQFAGETAINSRFPVMDDTDLVI